jgi:PEP-CTERM/exosortase A-associated glycosyltransferase
MRVLHVLHSGHPDTTGASIRSRYIAETQARLGIEPIVLTSPFQPPADPGLSTEVEWLEGVPYHRCFDRRYDHAFMVPRKSLATRARKLLALLPFMRRVRSLARDTGADLIHAHGLFYCGLAAAYAARSLGIPYVYEVRSLIEEGLVEEGGASQRGIVYAAYRRLDALALRLATHVVAISDGLRADLARRGVDPAKITVIGNGVDLERQAPPGAPDPGLRAALGVPSDALLLGYIGTLFAYESLDLAIRAVADLAPAHPKIHLLIVGGGNARAALEETAARLGVGARVRFAGPVPHDQIGRYYGIVDLFVLPRRPNRLTDLVTPLKPLEIMARGKPLLASDCGGHRELIRDGVNGFLFESGTSGALAARIAGLLAIEADLPAFGGRAREWATRHCSWKKVVAPTLALYQRLCVSRQVLAM